MRSRTRKGQRSERAVTAVGHRREISCKEFLRTMKMTTSETKHCAIDFNI